MKKRTGKMISLSLAVAMAMTAAPVTALADENTQGSVIDTCTGHRGNRYRHNNR